MRSEYTDITFVVTSSSEQNINSRFHYGQLLKERFWPMSVLEQSVVDFVLMKKPFGNL